ncbi:unnamed protein product [Lupinus luteus]|uniref:Methyltransferase n=1 Tax=Lupinus luteus TaxID=3873 RepID=A0AAV1WYP2_LUPLU
MALFKSRNNRRSSSPSYVSTLTTLLFIALCVFGVWMFRSNSGISPQTQTDEATSTRVAIDTSSTTNNDLSSNEDTLETTTKATEDAAETITNSIIEDLAETNSKIESQEDTSTTEDSAETNTKSESQKDTSTTTTVFGDNPGHLPDDAIKSDDKNNNNEGNKQKGDSSDSQISEVSSVTQEEQVTSMSESGSDQNFEPEKVQEGSVEAYEGNKKDEEGNGKAQDATESQNANEAETQELSTGQKQDVLSFDTKGSKNDEEEANKEQLREDKGEITKNDENITMQNEQQDENLESKKGETSQVSETESEKNENHGNQDESEQKHMPKAEKKDHKSKKAWATQADQSHDEKKRQKGELSISSTDGEKEKQEDNTWYICNVTAGADYIPCLDNEKAIKKLRSTKHFQHRERHCPEDPPTCLVSLPTGYKTPIEWPGSRDKIWYHNVPHTLLAEVKGHQNWVKVTGEYLTFPGGGTQFIHGALHYIDFLQQVGAAIYRKPTSNECYEQREKSEPPMCKDDDDPNAAWYVPLQACMHKVPDNKAERGARWPEEWPRRLQKAPYWLNNSQTGIYGKPAAKDFAEDNERWKNVVDELSNIGITWSNVRNVMDMKAVYGGCKLAAIMAEVDRIARPGGKLIVRDESSTIGEVEALLKSLHWEIIFSNEQKDLLSAKKGTWRPDSIASS